MLAELSFFKIMLPVWTMCVKDIISEHDTTEGLLGHGTRHSITTVCAECIPLGENPVFHNRKGKRNNKNPPLLLHHSLNTNSKKHNPPQKTH
jgi:hypothetical protein